MTVAAAGRVLRPAVPTVVTEEALSEVVAHYSSLDEFVIDVETIGGHRIDPRRNQVLWVGLAAEGRIDIIPLGHPNGELKELKRALLGSAAARLADGKELRRSDISKADSRARKVFHEPPEQLLPATVFEALQPVLFSSSRKIGANIKFDLQSIAKYYSGQVPPPLHGDVIIGDFLLDDTHQHQMGLAHIAKRRLGYTMPKGVGKEVEAFSFQEVARYLAGDVKFTWLLWKQIKAELEAKNLSSVMNLEMDVLNVVMDMEQTGTLVDVAALERLREELEEGIVTVTADAYRAAGKTFSVTSNADKRKMLFTAEGRNLTPKVFTEKTGEPATSEDALKAHPRDPLCKALLSLAELKKLMSAYVVPYLGGDVERTTAGKTKIITRESLLVNGRVHTSFKQHGARTGRFSSTNPNLQNIPSRGTYGPVIRSMFIPDPGHTLIVSDYSQIEPRVMASFSGDKTMLSAYNEGRDLYQAIADKLGVSRHAGKTLILAMAYGIGPSKIAHDLDMGVQAARSLLDDFARQFPALERYKAQVIREAARRRPVPYVVTVLGRRRLLPDLVSRDPELRSRGKRQAFNTMIQGSAADIMKLALIRAHKMIPEQSRVLLTVHDELVVMSPHEVVEETVSSLREAMEGVGLPQMKVPLKVEIGTGKNWSEAK